MKDKDMESLPDDSELVGVPFGFEKVNSEWFNGESQAIIAILFSKKTRDNYGGYMADYAHDYIAACRKIFEAGYDAVTVLEIPAPESACNILVIPSAACFSESDKAALKRWLDSGKTIIANGPFGVFDENAERAEKQFTDDSLSEILSGHFSESDITVVCGRGWYVRKFRDDKGRIILHAIAAEYELKMNEELEAKRAHIGGNNIITEIIPKNNVSVVNFKLMRDFSKIDFVTPLCSDQITSLPPAEVLMINIPEGCYYFILRLVP